MRASCVVNRHRAGEPPALRRAVQAAVQALSAHGAQFDFGHVQPAAVPGRVHHLQFLQQAARLRRRERLVPRSPGVGAEVVHHQAAAIG